MMSTLHDKIVTVLLGLLFISFYVMAIWPEEPPLRVNEDILAEIERDRCDTDWVTEPRCRTPGLVTRSCPLINDMPDWCCLTRTGRIIADECDEPSLASQDSREPPDEKDEEKLYQPTLDDWCDLAISGKMVVEVLPLGCGKERGEPAPLHDDRQRLLPAWPSPTEAETP